MYLMILLLMDRYEEFLVWGAYLVYLSPMKEQQSRRSNWWLSGGDNRYAHAADLNESLTCTSSLAVRNPDLEVFKSTKLRPRHTQMLQR